MTTVSLPDPVNDYFTPAQQQTLRTCGKRNAMRRDAMFRELIRASDQVNTPVPPLVPHFLATYCRNCPAAAFALVLSLKDKMGRVAAPASASAGDEPPTGSLFIGNLSYSTTPSDLYCYFSGIYGQVNILKCYIPIERETGRSRGFGFVHMPESVAQRALTSGTRHVVDGRVLKVRRGRRNPPAGLSSISNSHSGPPPYASDNCATCGYRPKYCTCPKPNVPAPVVYGRGPHPRPNVAAPVPPRVPPPIPPPPPMDRYRDERGGNLYDRDRRRYDDDYLYDRDRERSLRSRRSSRQRDHEESDGSSLRREGKSKRDDYDRRPRKRGRSRSREKSSSRKKKKSKRRSRSRSREKSSSRKKKKKKSKRRSRSR